MGALTNFPFREWLSQQSTQKAFAALVVSFFNFFAPQLGLTEDMILKIQSAGLLFYAILAGFKDKS